MQSENVVVDRMTDLMWQQAASSQPMLFRLALTWIDNLNKCGFAGFYDWRLPTLSEAMTLVEESPNEHGLYIDAIFNARQRSWIWTSERGGADLAWYVNFNYGYSQLNRTKSTHNSVRAVRQFS
ncbi:DUF1566 domain-containing protein [candidate division KSB1 bacterium]|nr:DUF1566 domain-containing protein [candidate division KSB1 bacterium]